MELLGKLQPMQTKPCSRCKEVRPIADFRLRAESRDGYAYTCKPCQKIAGQQYRARYADDPQFRAKRKTYAAEYHRKTWHDRRDRHHLGKVRARYGIEPSDYLALINAHGGRCAICKGAPTRTGRLHVDHDHATGQIRGLLCDSCNLGLGKFGDSPDRLRAAIAYLGQSGTMP